MIRLALARVGSIRRMVPIIAVIALLTVAVLPVDERRSELLAQCPRESRHHERPDGGSYRGRPGRSDAHPCGLDGHPGSRESGYLLRQLHGRRPEFQPKLSGE